MLLQEYKNVTNKYKDIKLVRKKWRKQQNGQLMKFELDDGENMSDYDDRLPIKANGEV